MGRPEDERMRIMQDEADRAFSREQYSLYRDRQVREQNERLDRHRQYVGQHGSDGAFYKTLTKWMMGAAVWAILSFFSAVADEGFFKAIGAAFMSFLFITGVGVARAYYVVNSAR